MEYTGNDLLEAEEHLCNLMLSYLKSMALKSAVELGIPDVIHKHRTPMSLSQLMSSLSIPHDRADPFRRLLRSLVHMDVIAACAADDHAELTYLLTPTSRLLVTDEPLALNPLMRLCLGQIMADPSHVMGSWFKAAQATPFELFHGKGLWEVANVNPEFNKMFNEGVASDSRLVVDVVLRTSGHVFSGLSSLTDCGAGTGAVALAIAKKFPEMKVTLFDLPHVIETLEPNPDVEYVGGDFFVSVPKANAVLLKWILHGWNDEECIKILKNCKKAIPGKEKNGKIIIIDMIINATIDDHSHIVETQYLFDLLLMTLVGGKERDESEWKKIIFAAGFTEYKITPFFGRRFIIEVYAWWFSDINK